MRIHNKPARVFFVCQQMYSVLVQLIFEHRKQYYEKLMSVSRLK